MENKVYNGKIVQVTEEVIGGINWERVYLPDGVIIFPINEEGKILMIMEKRPHENPPYRLKPVSGILEKDKGSALENAQRELQEEIGFKALDMQEFWSLKMNGTINNTHHFFVARNLIPSKLPNPDGEDTIMEVLAFDPQELMDKFLKDEIRWGHSTLGFIRLFSQLKA